MILWLEDQKIRHMKIEDRAGLRDVTSPKWSEAFQQVKTVAKHLNIKITANFFSYTEIL